MPRAPKPFLTAIYLQGQGWFLAAIIDRTKKGAAQRAFEQIEDPQGSTSTSLARYTGEVFFDPEGNTLWMQPAAWAGARTLAPGLFPKAFRDLVQARGRPKRNEGLVMPKKRSDLSFFGPLQS